MAAFGAGCSKPTPTSAAGVASNIEVVQAQDAVAVATERFISAQYGYALAQGALIRGVGTEEDALRLLLGGRR